MSSWPSQAHLFVLFCYSVGTCIAVLSCFPCVELLSPYLSHVGEGWGSSVVGVVLLGGSSLPPLERWGRWSCLPLAGLKVLAPAHLISPN